VRTIDLFNAVVSAIHDELGTQEAFENHADEVTEEEKQKILERIEEVLFPPVKKLAGKQKPADPPATPNA
jgi:rubrerythrin